MAAETHAVEHAAESVGHAVEHAAAAAHGAAAHGAEHAGGHGDIPHIANVISALNNAVHDNPVIAFLHHWEDLIFALLVCAFILVLVWRCCSKPKLIPDGGQNVFEMIVDGFDGLVRQVVGHGGREHTPFILSLFVYIWFMNLSGLIPGFKSSTASLNTTIGLASVVFGYVQLLAIRTQGPLKYLDHLAGQPRDAVGWLMVPLMLPIHVLGEFIRPISLSLRLGFNVFAEDVLLAVLVSLGIGIAAAAHLPIGVPLQFFVLPLILIFSTVQALVFSLLSTVYIALAVPHHEEHHEAHGEHH